MLKEIFMRLLNFSFKQRPHNENVRIANIKLSRHRKNMQLLYWGEIEEKANYQYNYCTVQQMKFLS